ncbi:hypothetical protein WDZ92_28905, partial [Nostoc sp. NIES-2111]
DDGGEKPGMIVPVGGTNLVAVDLQPGEQVKASRPHDITLHAVGEKDRAKGGATREWIFGLRDFAAYRDAPVAVSPAPKGTIFRVGVKKKIGIEQSIAVHAKDGSVVEKFPVVGLEKKTVTISIRPVMVKAPGGKGYRDHGKPNPVVADILTQMNVVWHPQANVVFALNSKTPLELDALPDTVNIDDKDMKALFKAAKDLRSKYTFFLVKQVSSGGGDDNGAAEVEIGIALLADRRRATTAAHEAGHLMGSTSGPTGRMDYGHPTTAEDRLMRSGGSAWKVTFDEAITFFNGNY